MPNPNLYVAEGPQPRGRGRGRGGPSRATANITAGGRFRDLAMPTVGITERLSNKSPSQQPLNTQEELGNLKGRVYRLEEEIIKQNVLIQLGVLVDNLNNKLAHWSLIFLKNPLQPKELRWSKYVGHLQAEAKNHLEYLPRFRGLVDYSCDENVRCINNLNLKVSYHFGFLKALEHFDISGKEYNLFILFKGRRNAYAHPSITADLPTFKINFCSMYKEAEEQIAVSKLISCVSSSGL